MSIILDKKDYIDMPMWRQLPVMGDASGLNLSSFQMISDPRTRNWKDPYIYVFSFNKNLVKYNPITFGTILTASSLTYTINPGCFATFSPSAGPIGTVTTTSSASSVTLNTALPAAVNINQLANRGDDSGFYIRIIGNSAGSSGKTEVRQIIANTAGTQPTVYFDTPLSFTPATGDAYELLSGKIFLLSQGTASFRSYDIATGAVAALSTTNLPATIATGSHFVALDEQITPMSKNEGEGLFGILTATATGATSLTGQAALGDATVSLNEYRNFQIRIVEDTAIPTAVGQRRTIVSHTAGASPVYTVTSWTVTPSATAKYVIESINLLVGKTTTGTTTYTYAPYAVTGGLNSGTGQAANTWSTTNLASGGSAGGTVNTSIFLSSAIELDMTVARTTARHSNIFEITAALGTNILDIAGAANGSWSNISSIDNGTSLNGNYMSATPNYASNGELGKGGCLAVNNSQNNYYFCAYSRRWTSLARIPYTVGTSSTGARRACMVYHYDSDDNKCVPFFTQVGNAQTDATTGNLPLYQLPLI